MLAKLMQTFFPETLSPLRIHPDTIFAISTTLNFHSPGVRYTRNGTIFFLKQHFDMFKGGVLLSWPYCSNKSIVFLTLTFKKAPNPQIKSPMIINTIF